MGRKRHSLVKAAFGNAELGGSGCWEWTGAKNRQGYGVSNYENRTMAAYRLAYMSEVGPVPEGMQLDHLCRNRACVRPSHLEAVPARINLLRGDNHAAHFARRTHCDKGHPFSGSNLSWYWNLGRRVRRCSACYRASYARSNAKARAKRAAVIAEGAMVSRAILRELPQAQPVTFIDDQGAGGEG
jgi:hypothetical protein